MGHLDWQVYRYNTGTAAWSTVSDVQNISFGYGQRQLTDTWSPPVWTINGRRPDLLGTVNIGDYFCVSFDTTKVFNFKVSNFEVHYGIKSSMDTWSLQIESPFSALARGLSTTQWTAGISGAAYSGDAATYVCQSVGVNLEGVPTQAQGCACSPQSIVNENAYDVFTRLARTSGPYIVGGADQFQYAQVSISNFTYPTLKWIPAVTPTSPDYQFTDSTVTSYTASYDALTFGSLNLNYANKVVVSPVGGAAQTVGSGNSAYETTTYSYTNNDALYVANRYAGLLAAAQQVPTSISYLYEAQSATAVLPNQNAILNDAKYCSIIFRGAVYYATIIGQELTATPDSTRVTLYLCASENGNFFTLDSASLGVLDQNRLGI